MRKLWKRRVYLDYVASAPVSSGAHRAFFKALSAFGNPDSPHEEGRRAKEILAHARSVCAKILEVKKDAVIFCGNATEANNLLVHGILHSHTERKEMIPHVLYASTSHSSLTKPLFTYGKSIDIETIPMHENRIDEEAFFKKITRRTVLVVSDRVVGETGTIIDTRALHRMLVRYAELENTKKAHLHIDASQSVVFEKTSLIRLGADSITFDAQKIGGIRGVGALVMPSHRGLVPHLQGGGQEEGIRPGTPAVAIIASFAHAFDEVQKNASLFTKRTQKLRDYALSGMVRILGNSTWYENGGKNTAPHILNISLLGVDTDYLVTLLDAKGIAISTKSACETESATSGAVFALTQDKERASHTIRISFGKNSSEHDIAYFLKSLEEVLPLARIL